MTAFLLDPENRVLSLLRLSGQVNTLLFVLPLAMLLVLLVECITSTITDTPVDVVDVGLLTSDLQDRVLGVVLSCIMPDIS